jgi:hypothetical protein
MRGLSFPLQIMTLILLVGTIFCNLMSLVYQRKINASQIEINRLLDERLKAVERVAKSLGTRARETAR